MTIKGYLKSFIPQPLFLYCFTYFWSDFISKLFGELEAWTLDNRCLVHIAIRQFELTEEVLDKKIHLVNVLVSKNVYYQIK